MLQKRDRTIREWKTKFLENKGTPKGCIIVLRERGISTRGMKLNEMHTILSSHADFKNEKMKLEHIFMIMEALASSQKIYSTTRHKLPKV